MRALFGADPLDAGTVTLDGAPVAPRSPERAARAGLAMISEERKADGLALCASVLDNAGMASMGRVSRAGVFDQTTRHTLVNAQVRALQICPAGIDRAVRELSGGNQQKVVIAKWLLTENRCVFIFDEPTRGVDVGTKVEIYEMIDDLARAGAPILLVSSGMPETQDIEPGVALSHEFVDEMTIDVQLRDDVLFHDGTPLTARDVAYTYNWVIDESSESHAQALISRWLDRAEVNGEYSVRFHLNAINPLIIHDMAQRVMLRKDDAYHAGDVVDRNAMAIELVGAGPYRVANFDPGVEVVLQRFDDFYGEVPEIGTIVVRNIPDVGTQQAELVAGGIKWMFNVPLDMARSLDAMPSIDHLAGPDLRVAFIVLDAGGIADPDGPLTDLRVRQAMNHAVNRPEIAEFLMGGGASEAIHTACHPVQFGCVQDVARYDYDPDRARALLADAGFPDGFALDLWAYRERPVAEAVMADLEAVGIDSNLRYVQLETLNQARASQNIAAYIGTWGSSGVADTALIARVHFSATSDRHLSGDAQVVDWVMAAEQTADQDARLELYRQAVMRIAEQAYWVPLVSYSADYLVTSDLEFPLDNDGVPRLQNARWR